MMQPSEPGDIVCSYPNCEASRPRLDTDDYARAAGWHLWSGKTVTGVDKTVILCPIHAGNTKQDRTKLTFEGEQQLW